MDHLAQIKADERATLEEIRLGVDRVALNRPFTFQQLGLEPVMADRWGQLWIVRAAELVRVK